MCRMEEGVTERHGDAVMAGQNREEALLMPQEGWRPLRLTGWWEATGFFVWLLT